MQCQYITTLSEVETRRYALFAHSHLLFIRGSSNQAIGKIPPLRVMLLGSFMYPQGKSLSFVLHITEVKSSCQLQKYNRPAHVDVVCQRLTARGQEQCIMCVLPSTEILESFDSACIAIAAMSAQNCNDSFHLVWCNARIEYGISHKLCAFSSPPCVEYSADTQNLFTG